MACSMLAAKHLSNEYWDEAIVTAVYIMNKCLTKSVKNKVSQEAWTCMKNNVVHLKVFGCVAYAHVPNELRKNLHNKRNKFIFVGYYEDTKAYKLYDRIERKVIIIHGVKFLETEAWDKSIERTVKILDLISHDYMEHEVVQTPIISLSAVPSTPRTTTQAQTTPVKQEISHQECNKV
jgi:hypothetical protein